VSSFKQLQIVQQDNLPKLAPLLIAQGTMLAVSCLFQTFGAVASGMQRFRLVRLYAPLCALSSLLVAGVGIMRVVTHFLYKSEWITECTTVVQNGSSEWIFGIWDLSSTDGQTDPSQYCSSQWSHDSWAEIIAVILVILLGLLFTSLAFAYYRQSLDPTSPINSSRLPADQARQDAYPAHYNPPYDGTAYMPVYLPPPGPPPSDAKPPEYKRGSYVGDDKDAKERDPFSDFDGPSVPMPTHWVEDREAAPPRRG